MITQIGAKYTGYLTRANSVLVAKQLVTSLFYLLSCIFVDMVTASVSYFCSIVNLITVIPAFLYFL